MKTENTKKFIIIGGLILILLLLGIVCFGVWKVFSVGNLKVTSSQEYVKYTIDSTGEYHVGEFIFQKLSAGKHKVSAQETVPGYFVPKNYTVNVKGNQTVNLEISLERRPGNPDISGEELP